MGSTIGKTHTAGRTVTITIMIMIKVPTLMTLTSKLWMEVFLRLVRRLKLFKTSSGEI